MEIKVLSDNEEKLFGRRNIVFSIVSSDKTASKEEALVELCKRLNLKPDATVITSIEQGFGVKVSTAHAHAYQDASGIKKFESKRLLERMERKGKAEGKGEKEEKAEA